MGRKQRFIKKKGAQKRRAIKEVGLANSHALRVTSLIVLFSSIFNAAGTTELLKEPHRI